MNTPFHDRFSKDKFKISSDLHLSHLNYCKGTSKWSNKSKTRDFSAIEDMNDCVINSINKYVKEDDVFFLLGDILFGDKTQLPKFRERIKCKTIHYLYGNHCLYIRQNREYQNLFTSCSDYLEIFVEKQFIILQHYPIFVWNKCHHNSWMLFGHQHSDNTYPRNGKTLDVGWDFRQKPLDFYEISDIMKHKHWFPIDHHNSNCAE